MAGVLSKGERVKVVKGRKAKGVTGTIFWVGDNKYGEGKRYGLHGDDGATHWVNADSCEAWDEPPAPVEEPDLVRGDRVSFQRDGEPAQGEVFWVGPSKHGPGTRVGVKLGDDETLWFDARQVDKLADDAPPPGAGPAPAAHPDGAPAPEAALPPMPDMPDFAPVDAAAAAPIEGDEPPPFEPDGFVDDGEPPPLADLEWVDD